MERSMMIPVAAILLVATVAVHAYDASLVVANVTECPVPVKKWEGFTTSDLISAFAPIIGTAPPSPCTSQVHSLATCAFDGSLEVQIGCCSTNCAEQLKLLQDQDCIPFVLEAICNATADQEAQVRRFVPILLGAADRCVGYVPPPQVDCGNGRVIPVELPSAANATDAGNTTAGTAGAENSTASEVPTVAQTPTFPGETQANSTPAASATQAQPAAAAPPAPAPAAAAGPPAPAAAPPASPVPVPTSAAVYSRHTTTLLVVLLAAAAVVWVRV